MKLFVSYRRSDSQHFAGRLAERLKHTRGINGVFFDIDSIGAGEDYEKRINSSLSQCAAVLVVIGPGWLANGRMFDDRDFVRMEVRAALAQSRVLPVLLDDTSMPDAAAMPDDLKPLVRLNAVQVRHAAFDRDLEYLIDAVLERKPPGTYAQFVRRNPLLAGVLEGIAGAIAAFLLLVLMLALINRFSGLALDELVGSAGLAMVVTLIVIALGAAAPWFLRRRGILR